MPRANGTDEALEVATASAVTQKAPVEAEPTMRICNNTAYVKVLGGFAEGGERERRLPGGGRGRIGPFLRRATGTIARSAS